MFVSRALASTILLAVDSSLSADDLQMDHEWLFWDNQDFMTQIGLGK